MCYFLKKVLIGAIFFFLFFFYESKQRSYIDNSFKVEGIKKKIKINKESLIIETSCNLKGLRSGLPKFLYPNQ
jgi:hypothetical protein